MTQRRMVWAVFLLSFAVLAYEVALIRVFSALLQHHFAFLAVSVAICGLGLGGLALHIRRRSKSPSEALLADSAAAFALTGVVVVVVLLTLVIPRAVTATWLAGALLLIPFGCAGVFLAELFATHSQQSGRLYAADLIGAATAALATLGLVQLAGAPNAAMIAAVAGGLAGVIAAPARSVRRRSIAASLVALGLVAINSFSGWLEAPAIAAQDTEDEGEARAQPLFTRLAAPLAERPDIIRTEWNAVIRTDVVEDPKLGARRHDVLEIYNNGNVPTRMLKIAGDLRTGSIEKLVQPLIDSHVIPPLAALPFQVGPRDRALFIGPGGGMDVLLALRAGFRHIEGAELNPSILPLMREYAEFNGHVYERPEVTVVTAEGRSYVRQSPHHYDLIYGALTQSATGTQGMALMESYLYTAEAFAEYWDRLSANGQLVFVVHNPLYVLRWLNTAADLLRRHGMTDVELIQHVMIAASPASAYSYVFALKKSPYTADDASALRAFSAEHRIKPLHFPPSSGGQLDPVMQGKQSLDKFLAAAIATSEDPINIEVTHDDRPFFMDLVPSAPRSLVNLVIAAIVLVVVFSGYAVWDRSRHKRERSGSGARSAAYFALLGAGFMLIEIPLMQKLTLAFGYPTLAVTATLFAILLGGGIGSAVSQRISSLRSLTLFAAAMALLVALFAIGIGQGVASFQPLMTMPLVARAAVLISFLLCLGFCLGVPFPAGMRLLGEAGETSAPWMWGVNGVMSVVGSVGAALGARIWGFGAMLAIGACLYVLVCAHLLWQRRSAS
ncbi:MAG: hypothetical protein AB7R00_07250 [Kofleriaceae bacterium]